MTRSTCLLLHHQSFHQIGIASSTVSASGVSIRPQEPHNETVNIFMSRYVKTCQEGMTRYVRICQDMTRYVKTFQHMTSLQQIRVDSPRPIAHTSTMILAQDKSTIPIIAICHFLSGL